MAPRDAQGIASRARSRVRDQRSWLTGNRRIERGGQGRRPRAGEDQRLADVPARPSSLQKSQFGPRSLRSATPRPRRFGVSRAAPAETSSARAECMQVHSARRANGRLSIDRLAAKPDGSIDVREGRPPASFRGCGQRAIPVVGTTVLAPSKEETGRPAARPRSSCDGRYPGSWMAASSSRKARNKRSSVQRARIVDLRWRRSRLEARQGCQRFVPSPGGEGEEPRRIRTGVPKRIVDRAQSKDRA